MRMIALSILLAAWSAQASAVQTAARWRAASETASSITGNVVFAPNRITFANGKSLTLAFVKTSPGLSWAPGSRAGLSTRLYRVTAPKDPVLLRGNRLCGEGPVTYVSVARRGGYIFLSTYTDKAEPTAARNNLCGGFTYAPMGARPR